MKNPAINWLIGSFFGILVMGCPVYEAALQDQASTAASSSTETSSSSSSSTTVTISPSGTSVVKGRTQTFTASGATTPLTWSVGDSSFGSIDSSGVFTASSSKTGSTTISVTDSKGNSASTSVTII